MIDPLPPLSRLPALFGVYLAGDSVNYLAPGSVAGEPVKARLLRGAAGTAAGSASVTIHKHADLAAQWLFVSPESAAALWRVSRAARAADAPPSRAWPGSAPCSRS